MGKSQVSLAKKYKVSRSTYLRWEHDEVKGPNISLKNIQAYERCVIMRRRSGITQEEVAKGLGYSRFWVNQMEHGNIGVDELLWYWEQ